MTIINEGKNYRELNDCIKMIKRQRSDTQKINLIEESKKIGIGEVIKRNEINNNRLKSQL